MNQIVPNYFLIICLVLLFIRELRKWIELSLALPNDDDENKEIPECCRHMYS